MEDTQSVGSQLHPTVVPPQGGKTVSVLGMSVEILASGEQTRGAFSAYRVDTPPGSGPPMHVHRKDDEAFYVLSSEFEVRCGDKSWTATPGTFVFLPRDIPHAFRNVGPTLGQLLGVATPPDHEKFFEDIHLVSLPPDPEEVARICSKHGLDLVHEG